MKNNKDFGVQFDEKNVERLLRSQKITDKEAELIFRKEYSKKNK